MHLSCVRPKLANLRFLLYTRPVHPELFEIVREKRIRRDGYQAIVRITDACHTISWRHADICLSELLVPVNHPLPRTRQVLFYKLRRERNEMVQCARGVVYQTSFAVERVEPELFIRIQDELSEGAAGRGLVHYFQPHHRLAPSPLSYIAIEPRRQSLLVQAFHTFPDECAIVKSQSLFEFGG